MEIKNKKSQIFMMITIAVLILFITGLEVYSVSQDRSAIKERILTMEDFLFSLEKNLERNTYIIGYRTIFLSQDYITKTGRYVPNINDFFREAFFNGSVYGNSSDILIGVTYDDILSSINEKSSSINVQVNMTDTEIQVYQQDPWNVAFELSFSLTVQDKGNLASWKKQEKIKSLIPTEEFEDPLYIINTNGKVSYKPNKTVYGGVYAVGEDISNLKNHISRRYYAENPNAPSFLNRIQGNFNSDVNGIESLIDLSYLSQQGISIKDKSAVDYVYFSDSNPVSHHIQGMPLWFRIDDLHLTKYNLTGLTTD